MILAEKIERKVYVNQEDFVSHIRPPSWLWFLLSFLRELLMSITCNSLLSRDVTSVLSVQMVVKGKWQGKLLLQNIYMYMIVTLKVVYDHVGNSVSLRCAILYFENQSNFILPDHHLEIGNEISSKKSRGWNLRIDTIWAAVVNPIQIGREYCIVLKVQMHLNNHVNQLFWWYELF